MGTQTPKKCADSRRAQVTQEWQAWDAERRTEAADEGYFLAASIGAEPSMYFPEQDGRAVPEDGAWIIVVEEPFTELRSRFRVPPLSMWRARPHELNTGAIVLKGVEIHPKQAVIATPGETCTCGRTSTSSSTAPWRSYPTLTRRSTPWADNRSSTRRRCST